MSAFDKMSEWAKVKSRYVAKLFRDSCQISEDTLLRISRRPPLTLSANAEQSWQEPGEIEFTFSRAEIEPCDEIWLGHYKGDILIEEWELLRVRVVPNRLYTSHIPGDEEWEEDESQTQVKYIYEYMRYKDDPNQQWEDWSNL